MAVRRLVRNRLIWVLLIWTVFIAVPIVLLWPAANAPLPPCNYPGGGAQDPALPTCPPDNANYEAILMSLLVLVWLAGIVCGLISLGISRFLRRRERPLRRTP
jgi:hypothetical protein